MNITPQGLFAASLLSVTFMGAGCTAFMGNTETLSAVPVTDTSSAIPSGMQRICWSPFPTVSKASEGFLMIRSTAKNSTWQTVTESTGEFSMLCLDVNAITGETILVNGKFSTTEPGLPDNPWYIAGAFCTNTTSCEYRITGSFTVNGVPANVSVVENGEGGADANVLMP